MTNISSAALAITMVAALVLAFAATRLLRDRQTRVRGVLMLVAALVLVMNVMIWTVSPA